MAKMAKPLPEQDIHALFDVVVVLLGELVGGQVPAELTAMMVRRLARDGFLDHEASAGELGAVVSDLAQRLHYAMGAYDSLPEPSPRTTTYSLLMPTEAAARACQAELTASGGSDVLVRDLGADGWKVLTTFPELSPDPAFREREAQLEALARRHRGRFSGSQR
jgi:hypothetical protein